MRSERLDAVVEILDSPDERDEDWVLCGGLTSRMNVRARVVTASRGAEPGAEIMLAWRACEVPSAVGAVPGARFQVRAMRWIDARGTPSRWHVSSARPDPGPAAP